MYLVSCTVFHDELAPDDLWPVMGRCEMGLQIQCELCAAYGIHRMYNHTGLITQVCLLALEAKWASVHGDLVGFVLFGFVTQQPPPHLSEDYVIS